MFNSKFGVGGQSDLCVFGKCSRMLTLTHLYALLFLIDTVFTEIDKIEDTNLFTLSTGTAEFDVIKYDVYLFRNS